MGWNRGHPPEPEAGQDYRHGSDAASPLHTEQDPPTPVRPHRRSGVVRGTRGGTSGLSPEGGVDVARAGRNGRASTPLPSWTLLEDDDRRPPPRSRSGR